MEYSQKAENVTGHARGAKCKKRGPGIENLTNQQAWTNWITPVLKLGDNLPPLAQMVTALLLYTVFGTTKRSIDVMLHGFPNLPGSSHTMGRF